MFSFKESFEILEKEAMMIEMEEKYHDRFMIVTNSFTKDSYIGGDIIAILTRISAL